MLFQCISNPYYQVFGAGFSSPNFLIYILFFTIKIAFNSVKIELFLPKYPKFSATGNSMSRYCLRRLGPPRCWKSFAPLWALFLITRLDADAEKGKTKQNWFVCWVCAFCDI